MKTILEIEPPYRQALTDAGLADFDALMRVRGGEPTSRHRHRETIPLEMALGGERRRFFLKRVYQIPLEHNLLPLLRGRLPYSQPMREWRMIRKLEQAGIPVMRRIAVGQRSRLGRPLQALLLVEAVPMEHTVQDWLAGEARPAPALSRRDRGRLLAELGEMVFKLHCRGFRWPDIHPKHVFASRSAQSRDPAHWQFQIIDVERMRRSEKRGGLSVSAFGVPDEPAVWRDLDLFVRRLRTLGLGRWDVLRFWAGYKANLRGWAGDPRERRSASHEALARRGLLDESPRRDRWAAEADAIPLERFDGLSSTRPGLIWLGSLGISGMADVFAGAIGTSLRKPGLRGHRDRTRVELAAGNGSPRVLYLKRFVCPPVSEQLRRILESRPRRSSAWREMHFAKVLGELGIATMRRVAYGEEMSGWWERRSFTITEQVPGQSLEKIAARAVLDPTAVPPPPERHEIVRQLAIITRLLHHQRLYHRDLYLSHVFMSHDGEGAVLLHLIDLARMIEKPVLGARWAIKDLAALEYSTPTGLMTRTDRLRFLRTYLGGIADDKRIMRYYLRRVRDRAWRMARHDARRMARPESGASL